MSVPLGRLRHLGEDLRSSLWFVPSLVVLGGVALAVALIEAESVVQREHLSTRWPRLFGAGAEGARGLLAAIASSMITVAGVAFSVTMVTFALAASQYTSRILRNFMRDRSNQAVLGVFLGVFAYCLVVLRTIRGGDEGVFVPSLAVMVAVLLAFVAIGFLVFFIHHTAASIQASNIIQGASEETIGVIDRLFPEFEDGSDMAAAPGSRPDYETPSDETWTALPARTTGYIQAVDVASLDRLARKTGTVIRMDRAIGDFVIEGTPLASLSSQTAHEWLIDKVNGACTFGRYRTIHQDASFGIRQIVDIALKALSPGINDTTTAVICIDSLSAIMVRASSRRLDNRQAQDGQMPRVILPGPTFAELVRESFDQIRQNAYGNVAILTRLLQVLETITGQTRNPARRRELLEQAVLVMEVAERSVPAKRDLVAIKATMDRSRQLAILTRLPE
jgi:uncharacterized membrane protein